MLDVLLRFHRCECVTEAFVLYDSGVAYALVFAEDAMGKQVTFPSNLQGLVDEVINLDIAKRKAWSIGAGPLLSFGVDGDLGGDVFQGELAGEVAGGVGGGV